MSVLVLNCGSSSVKYALYDPDATAFICRGLVERVGQEGGFIRHVVGDRQRCIERDCPDHGAAIELVLSVLRDGPDSPLAGLSAIQAVGHRAVHGGERYARSARVTGELIRTMEQLSDLAPLHNPPNLAGIRAIGRLLPEVPQVAVFDTAFHQSMPPEAFIYPLPYDWYERHGIRRYGFHGTSHLYVSRRAAVLMKRPLAELKLVTLHIGNGASACAVAGGKSVDTSMGFTPLEGLVMGTRSGWIDPAVPLFVMEKKGLSTDDMDHLLNKQSGLLGITGRFSDRRDILQAAQAGDARCKLALEVETRALRKTIGAYAALMDGLDGVVFTAGVGENSAEIRKRSVAGLGFLGIELDADRNRQAVGSNGERLISTEGSRVAVMVIPTNEELVIAQDTLAVLSGDLERPDFAYSFES